VSAFAISDALVTEALAAADAGAAVERALGAGALGDAGPVERWHVFALGKAAPPMARAALAHLGGRAAGGAVVAPQGAAGRPPGLAWHEAPHPLPDERSLRAGRDVLARARRLGPGEGALVLLSGGASSLAEVPAPGLTLADVRRAHELFLKSGLAIVEVNALRRALSDFKGGRLGAAFGRSPFVTLVLADVVRGGPEFVASGPTAPVGARGEPPADLARRAGLWADLPPAVRRRLGAPREPPAFAPRPLRVVADVGTAARAAARAAEALGFRAELLTLALEGEARDAGAAVARAGLAGRGGGRRCLLWGGETTVRVRGAGRGGRNQELALAAALALDGREGVHVTAVATDGVDGPTDAAGARVDGTTAAAARAAGLDPRARLDDNDAYAALDAAGALVRTGPTATNVNDLAFALLDAAP
jgi:glycerate-2-kinase